MPPFTPPFFFGRLDEPVPLLFVLLPLDEVFASLRLDAFFFFLVCFFRLALGFDFPTRPASAPLFAQAESDGVTTSPRIISAQPTSAICK